MSASSYLIAAVLLISCGLYPIPVLATRADPPRQELKIVYAINAGGVNHEDIHGIVYLKDPSTQGVASDFGMRTTIDRVHPQDQALYQTERYSPNSFGYDIPMKEDGSYVLVLKFSEVYFRNGGAKVFNVMLNSKHVVAEDLDIFAQVGYATAHDVLVPFVVTDNVKKLIVDGATSSTIRGNRIRLDFVKGSADNPKVNAFYIAKGLIEDVPQLPAPYQYEEQEEYDEGPEDTLFGDDDEEEIQFSRSDLGADGNTRLPVYRGQPVGSRKNIRSGPPADDPWENESPLTIYTPLFASVAASVASFFFLRLVNGKL